MGDDAGPVGAAGRTLHVAGTLLRGGDGEDANQGVRRADHPQRRHRQEPPPENAGSSEAAGRRAEDKEK